MKQLRWNEVAKYVRPEDAGKGYVNRASAAAFRAEQAGDTDVFLAIMGFGLPERPKTKKA